MGDRPQRYGVTIPLGDAPLLDQRARLERLVELGYDDVWTAEVNGHDAFTPLALAALWTEHMRLATAIVSPFTRGPALLAQTVATMAELAPGRFTLGLGTSTRVIVERWNAAAFDRPYQRSRDTIRFLRDALGGERVDTDYETFSVHGFRLARPPETPPPILLAALRPGMLRLAAREADGAITNWLSAGDVERVRGELGPSPELVARIFVCPTPDADLVRAAARREIAGYLNVDVYRKFHEWLGRGDRLGAMWEAWEAGDRKAAVAAVPDDVVDELFVHGTPAQCREHVQRYFDNGVDTVTLAVFPWGDVDLDEALEALAPVTER